MDYFSSICVVLMIRVGEWFFWSGRKVEQFKDLLWELNASVIVCGIVVKIAISRSFNPAQGVKLFSVR